MVRGLYINALIMIYALSDKLANARQAVISLQAAKSERSDYSVACTHVCKLMHVTEIIFISIKPFIVYYRMLLGNQEHLYFFKKHFCGMGEKM